MIDYCKKCGRALTHDEIGLYKKLCGKLSESYCCLTCLSEHFQVTEELLQEKIKQLKAIGCGLFTHVQEEE